MGRGSISISKDNHFSFVSLIFNAKGLMSSIYTCHIACPLSIMLFALSLLACLACKSYKLNTELSVFVWLIGKPLGLLSVERQFEFHEEQRFIHRTIP